MSVKKFLDSKETYDKVLKLLSEKAGVSVIDAAINKYDDGFIAGGSVANVVNYLIHGVEPVIRDIDIFHHHIPKEQDDLFSYHPVNSEVVEFSEVMGVEFANTTDWYGNSHVYEDGTFSLLVSTTREGVFNYVEIYTKILNGNNFLCGGDGRVLENDELRHKRNQIILKGFDINSCKIGIDLKLEKLVYSEDFVDFMESREMLITTTVNPIQTMIRLKKKIKDLDCYCNIEREIKILQYVTLMLFGNGSNKFGEETYEKYLEHKEFIDKYFYVKKLVNPTLDFNLSDKIRKKKIEIKLWGFEPKMETYDVKYHFSHPDLLLRWFRITDPTVSKKKRNKLNKVVNFIEELGKHKTLSYYDLVGINDYTMRKYRRNGLDVCFKKFLGVKVKKVNHWMWQTLLINKTFYYCDFSKKHLEYINNLFEEHRGLQQILTNNYQTFDTIQGLYNFLRELKSISNKFGDWVIGALETMDNNSYKNFISCNNKIEWFQNYIEEKEKELKTPLIEPIDLTEFEYVDCVKELVTDIELRAEGSRMGHCVGGYSNSIKSGKSRIFHIECNGVGSTLEIKMKYRNIWPKFGVSEKREIPEQWVKYCDKKLIDELTRLDHEIEHTCVIKGQHYGRYPEKGNLTPTEENKKVVEELIGFINKNYKKSDLAELLLKRHHLEHEVRKISWENELKEKNNKRVDEAIENGQDHVTLIEQEYPGNIPMYRNIEMNDDLLF